MREGSGTAPEVSPRVDSTAGPASGPSASAPGSEHLEHRRGSGFHPTVCPGRCLLRGSWLRCPAASSSPSPTPAPGLPPARSPSALPPQRCAFRASSPDSLCREIVKVLSTARFTSLFSAALLSVPFSRGCWSRRAGQRGLPSHSVISHHPFGKDQRENQEPE